MGRQFTLLPPPVEGLGPSYNPFQYSLYIYPTNIFFQLHRHLEPAVTISTDLLRIILLPTFCGFHFPYELPTM